MELSAKIDLDQVFEVTNVAELLSPEDQKLIADLVVETFEMDRQSRAEWETRMKDAAKIALQVVEEKTFPWPGASNVKFPLLTVAALQYHSRVYPALIDTPNIVQCIAASDPNGQLAMAAEAVQSHMNWQLLEEDDQWEEEMDKTFFVQALMGTAIKKTYFDATKGHNVSELVLPQDFVVGYNTRNLEECPRATHILSWSSNYMVERQRRGLILTTDVAAPKATITPFGELDSLSDEVQGLVEVGNDPDTPIIILEQLRELDLDGDNYKEPYVIQVRYDTKELLRISPTFLPSGIEKDGDQILRIYGESYYTKYGLVPSPDGGFYDLGFGALLGPLNESINTAINQLFDAGTMANAGGGFLGRGAKFKSGDMSFRPNEWKRVDATGDDLRKSIVELPRPQPSPVLFQLLSLLIDFGQRVAGATDAVQGINPGQNTPAETQRSMVEQGSKIFGGIYKRTYRSLRSEIRKLYRLNSLYLDNTVEFSAPQSGHPMKVLADFYQLPSSMLRPAAASEYMSETQKVQQAMALLQVASSAPGYDVHRAHMFYLKALKIPNPELFHPDPRGPNAIPAAPDIKIQLKQMEIQAKQQELQLTMRVKMMELMEEHDLNRAKILELEAKALEASANANSEDMYAKVAALNAALTAAKIQQEGRVKSIELMRDLLTLAKEPSQNGPQSIPRMASPAGDAGISPAPPISPIEPSGELDTGEFPVGPG